jgi:hypothetical protein
MVEKAESPLAELIKSVGTVADLEDGGAQL